MAIDTLIGIIFALGIAFAMNEGYWFPFINIIGLVMVFVFGAIATGRTGK